MWRTAAVTPSHRRRSSLPAAPSLSVLALVSRDAASLYALWSRDVESLGLALVTWRGIVASLVALVTRRCICYHTPGPGPASPTKRRGETRSPRMTGEKGREIRLLGTSRLQLPPTRGTTRTAPARAPYPRSVPAWPRGTRSRSVLGTYYYWVRARSVLGPC
eukprot:3385134-Rhodomonas_salina.1